MTAHTAASGVPTSAASQIRQTFRRIRNQRIAASILLVLCALALFDLLLSGTASHLRVVHAVPFQPGAQRAVNGIDGFLAVTGSILLPTILLAIGLIKLFAFRSPRLMQLDLWSSMELTDMGHRKVPRRRQLLRVVLAGGIPLVAAAGVSLAVLTSSIGSEVANGPDRPINAAFSRYAPGDQVIVGYSGAMPMVESDVSFRLAQRITSLASGMGVPAHALGLDLGIINAGHRDLAALTLGLQVSSSNLLSWNASEHCKSIPAVIDRDAGLTTGSYFIDDGYSVRVVGITSGISATNRIGVVMDETAMATCLQKNPDAPVQAIVIQGSQQQASRILHEANSDGEVATVISTRRYLENSQAFWTSNVKPITNTLALVAGLVAIIAMAGSAASRLLRNRREYAGKLAAGVPPLLMTATELLRGAKDAVAASLTGCLFAFLLVPLTNALEPGFQASVTTHDLFVGCAIGAIGCICGAGIRSTRIARFINVEESTRI